MVLGLENSLSPADNKKLVDLVGHPAVGVYYDLHNMAFYGHAEQAIPGVKLLGKQRISMVHVKNGNHLLEEAGPIDWAAAFRALNDIQYDGWYVYETSHDSIRGLHRRHEEEQPVSAETRADAGGLGPSLSGEHVVADPDALAPPPWTTTCGSRDPAKRLLRTSMS